MSCYRIYRMYGGAPNRLTQSLRLTPALKWCLTIGRPGEEYIVSNALKRPGRAGYWLVRLEGVSACEPGYGLSYRRGKGPETDAGTWAALEAAARRGPALATWQYRRWRWVFMLTRENTYTLNNSRYGD